MLQAIVQHLSLMVYLVSIGHQLLHHGFWCTLSYSYEISAVKTVKLSKILHWDMARPEVQ